jgi:hypothetical protein
MDMEQKLSPTQALELINMGGIFWRRGKRWMHTPPGFVSAIESLDGPELPRFPIDDVLTWDDCYVPGPAK